MKARFDLELRPLKPALVAGADSTIDIWARVRAISSDRAGPEPAPRMQLRIEPADGVMLGVLTEPPADADRCGGAVPLGPIPVGFEGGAMLRLVVPSSRVATLGDRPLVFVTVDAATDGGLALDIARADVALPVLTADEVAAMSEDGLVRGRLGTLEARRRGARMAWRRRLGSDGEVTLN